MWTKLSLTSKICSVNVWRLWKSGGWGHAKGIENSPNNEHGTVKGTFLDLTSSSGQRKL